MYIHIGGEYVISTRYIVAVLDMETVYSTQKDVLHYIKRMEEQNRTEYVTEDIPKSVVITIDKIYMTGLSTQVLLKRAEKGYRDT